MPERTDHRSVPSDLRERAEEALYKELPEESDPSQLSSEDLRGLLHELRVHQIELDMQNEELRRAQREVEESRDRYAELYDFAPVGYLTLSNKGLIEEINLAGSQLLGVQRTLLINRPLARFVRIEDLSVYYEYLTRLFSSGTRHVIDIGMKRYDSTSFHARLEGTPVKDSEGDFTSCRLICSDMTELSVALETVRENRNNLQAIFSVTPESVLLLDPGGHVLAANETSANSLDVSVDELIGKSVYAFLETEVRESRKKRLADVLASGKPIYFEDEREGESFEHSLYPVLGTDGKAERIAIFARNVTQQKQAARRIRESEERFRAVFESASECIFIMDTDLRYTHVNPAVTRLFGIPASEIVGKGCEYLYGEDLGKHISEINERVLAGERIEHQQVRVVGHTPLAFHDIRVPLRDNANRIVGLCCLSRYRTPSRGTGETLTITSDDYPSQAMQKTLKLARSAARSKSIVLLQGESGSGKDYLARWIHDHSPQAQGPFLSVNCAALPSELAESELFGHERGAFTGASVRKKGQLELAEGGTVLLNEIGELDLSLQSKLLAFLDTSSFLRVGGEKPVRVNARLLAATHRNLELQVSQDLFLGPLFYRLSVVPIDVPPLRERLEDIPILVKEIMAKAAAEMQLSELPVIDEEHVNILSRYTWPGNVRELRNVIERSLMLWDGGRLRLAIEKAKRRTEEEGLRIRYVAGKTLREAHWEVTRYLCDQALRQSRGKKKEAAALLGISRDAFYRYLKILDNKS